jgi:AcrR family transcriptional regulator
MARLTPRQAERQERILKTVRDHLSRLGYEGLSMREVADAAGVSPTTLYNLFQNKDSLVLAAQQDLLEQLAQLVRSEKKTGLQRLVASAEAISDQVVRTPRYADAMVRLLFKGDPGDPICQILLGDVIRQNRGILKEMLELEEVRADIDVELLARRLAGSVWSTILLWVKGFIALHDFKREYVSGLLMTLMPFMTPTALRRYRKRLHPVALRAIS